jgi:hypothetical protein
MGVPCKDVMAFHCKENAVRIFAFGANGPAAMPKSDYGYILLFKLSLESYICCENWRFTISGKKRADNLSWEKSQFELFSQVSLELEKLKNNEFWMPKLCSQVLYAG